MIRLRSRCPQPVRTASGLAGFLLLGFLGCAGVQRPLEPPEPAAIPDLEARVEADSGDVAALVRLGAAYREADRLEDARQALEAARRRQGAGGAAAFFLGLTYEELEEYGAAREAYRGFLDAAQEGELADRIRGRLEYLHRKELAASAREALRREGELADREPSEGTLAVFPFLYRGSDRDLKPLSRAMTAFLVTDLSQTDRLTVLERVRVQLLLDEMELAEEGYVDRSTAARTGRLLGAARLVQGSLSGSEEELAAEAALVDAREDAPDEVGPVVSDRRPAEELFAMEERIALGVYDRLGIELTAAERERVTDEPTGSLEAVRAFGRGLIAEDSADYDAAARHYQQAVELDPDFRQARERAQSASELSAASGAGPDELARAAAEAARERTSTASARDALETDATTEVASPADRDAVAETLGVEGADPTVLIRILIPTPGGGG